MHLVLCHIVSTRSTLKDALLADWALSVVILLAAAEEQPVLLAVVAHVHHADVVRLLRAVVIRHVPIPAVGIGVDRSIELDGAPEPVPLVIPIIGVAEAQHLVDLSACRAYFNMRFELDEEVCVAELILGDVILKVHCILIDVEGVLARYHLHIDDRSDEVREL